MGIPRQLQLGPQCHCYVLVPREGHIPPWTNDMIALLGIVKLAFSGNQSTPTKELGETTQERMVHKGYTTQGIVHMT